MHMLMEALAFFLGFRFFVYLRKQNPDPLESNNRLWVIIGATAGALLGSRLLGALEDPAGWWQSEHFWLSLFASKTIVGGLLGGLFGVELVKKIIGEKSSSGDLFVFPLVFAMSLGRIGCLSMGVYEPTYGRESSLPWAFDFGDGILRHPLPLYEILFLVAMAALFLLLEKQFQFKNGIRFRFFLMGYLLFRFCIEFLKPNTVIIFAGLGSLQIACLLGTIYYARTWTQVLFRPKQLLQT